MIRFKESHCNEGHATSYTITNEGTLEKVSIPSYHGQGLFGIFRQILLPEGYPDSVSSDYLEYQGWDTLQAFASSISGSLATAAVLEGVGVGDAEATALAATLTWILKDGAGMIGRILFAAYIGTSLDYDCKRWRLFADVLNDGVMMVELMATALPKQLVMPTLCAAGVGRSLVGVAGGATKAAVAQHQARKQNMADLAAKDGSQETVVNLLALCVNLLLLPAISGKPSLPFYLFMILASLHIYSNYRAVRCLVIPTLNASRLVLVLSRFKELGNICSVFEINRLESVIWPPSSKKARIEIGVSVQSLTSEEVSLLCQAIREEDPCILLGGDKCSKIVISSLAKPKDVYKMYIKAYLGPNYNADEVLDSLELAGWNLSTLALPTRGYVLQVDQ